MIQFVRNGVVVFDLAWLVNPFTWTGRIALSIGLPVLTKIFLETDFYRNNSPLSIRYNHKLRTEIESKFLDNLPDIDPRQQLEAFPTLSFDSIKNLQENGFIRFEERAKIPGTSLTPEMPVSFRVTIRETNRTYQVFNTERLGAGAFGEAFIGQDTSSGAWVAVKLQPLKNIAKEQAVLLENRNLLEDHKLLGHAIIKRNGNSTLISIMPLFVKDNPSYCNSSEKLDFLIAVANELKRLHQNNKIHSDLHLGNVCWNKAKGIAHLIDYGSIVDARNPSEIYSHYVPKLYRPPESVFGLGLLHVKAGDIYALGCMARRLFENTHNARLDSLISTMQHSLFFKRPSLDTIINELTSIKAFVNDIVEDPIVAANQEEQQCLDKMHDDIAHYKSLMQQIEAEITIAQANVDFIHLAMLTKEKSVYQERLRSLISSIDLYNRFQIPFQRNNEDELQKDLKKLVALKPDYQPRVPVVKSSEFNSALFTGSPSAGILLSNVLSNIPSDNDTVVYDPELVIKYLIMYGNQDAAAVLLANGPPLQQLADTSERKGPAI